MKQLLTALVLVLLLATSVSAKVFQLGMISQDPDPVQAGDVVKVRFKIENLWEETKYNVLVRAVPEYPFSIYGGSEVIELGRLDGTRLGSGPVYFDFKFRVDHEALDGDHEMTLMVDDEESVEKFENMFFVEVEKERIALRPYIVASDLIIPGTKGTFTIEIANAGGLDVQSLELELLPSGDYRLLSTSNYIYLGDIEADDTESEDFSIYVEKGIQQVHIPVRLTYEVDDKNYTDDTKLVLNLLTEAEAKKIGLIKESYLPYIIGALVIVVVAIIVIRRRRR